MKTQLYFRNKWEIDINDPDSLNKIDKLISGLFSIASINSKNLVNDLNDLLTIHNLIVRRNYFFLPNKEVIQ